VYRLVTSGSVEECIVQRAQRKLFLDGMVNRGSTAQAQLEADQVGVFAVSVVVADAVVAIVFNIFCFCDEC